MNSHSIANWAYQLNADNISEEIKHAARRCIVDAIGVAIAGADFDVPAHFREKSLSTFSKGQCTTLGTEHKLPAEAAAFLNAISGHILDFDDTCYSGIAHASAVVWPAVIAAAEESNADGEALLTAFICGVETIFALGRGFGDDIYWDGWWTSSLLGAIGAAVAATKLYGGNQSQIASAVEFASAQATGRRVVFGNAAKAFGIGKASSLGIEAAKLAMAGLVPPSGSIEGDLGMVNLFNKGRWHAGDFQLGETWGLLEPGIAFKMYPCCSAAQAAMDALMHLLKESKTSISNVESIHVEVTPFVEECLIFDDPKTIPECQFSVQFPLACGMVWKEFNATHLNSQTVNNKKIQHWIKRIKKEVTPELTDIQNSAKENLEAARVTVHFENGQQVSKLIKVARGMPQNPANDQILEQKFIICSQLDSRLSKNVVEKLWKIDQNKSFNLESLLYH